MRGLLAAVAVLVAGAAGAEDWNDYGLVMQQNAENVVSTLDGAGGVTLTLDMGDGVTVVCDAEGCIGQDSGGAVGCMLRIVTELRALAATCPGMADDSRRAGLEGIFDRAGAFAAANAVPPRDWAAMRAEIDGRAPPNGCPLPGSDADVMMQALSTPESIAQMDRALERPRLPVAAPCL
jgi:hypothetical protein